MKTIILSLLVLAALLGRGATVAAEWRSVGTLAALKIRVLAPACHYRAAIETPTGSIIRVPTHKFDEKGLAWGGPSLFFSMDAFSVMDLPYIDAASRSAVLAYYYDPAKYVVRDALVRVVVRPPSASAPSSAFAYLDVYYYNTETKSMSPSSPKWNFPLDNSKISLELECNVAVTTTPTPTPQ